MFKFAMAERSGRKASETSHSAVSVVPLRALYTQVAGALIAYAPKIPLF